MDTTSTISSGDLGSYGERRQRLELELRSRSGVAIGLGKDTSNLFRDRVASTKHRLEVKDFNKVLRVNTSENWVEVEGMTTYEDLVDATLPHGVMPTVVPQLKSITVGGAISGVGIESSSFKYGLVHESVLEMDILLSDGHTVTCTPDNEHRALFYGFANSYGTLGYVLKVKVETVPVKRYVHLRHLGHSDAAEYFRSLDEWCHRDVDFLDGVVFSRDEQYLTIGTFVDDAPYASDYTYKNIYYRSIQTRSEDYLHTLDYIWRWDTDWFWCSKHFFVQNPLIRRIVGRSFLNSVTYSKIMRWNSRWGLTRRACQLFGVHGESVIQDVDIPIERAAEFLQFFQREIGITPVWICPIHAYKPEAEFDLYPLDPGSVYVNFGFWDVVRDRKKLPSGHYNRKIERKVAELGGIKSLYSDSFYSPEEFWQIYQKPVYDKLKARYDSQRVFKDLYQKCALRE